MKLFSSEQIRNWDAYTIQHEPIASIDLMERAATASVEWLILQNLIRQPIHIFCGKGNNGADGLAIARLLLKQGCTVSVYILEFGFPGTDEFQTNLHRLHGLTFNIHFIQEQGFFPEIPSGHLIIDSIFGTGLNKPLEGITEKLIQHLNQSNNLRVAIDIPTGMFADKSSKDSTVFHADYTLSFQVPKLCFFLNENQDLCGAVHILDIGLLASYAAITESNSFLTEVTMMKQLIRPRHSYAHKGNYGHALIMGGSYGKMGAALLAAKACLHSGSGLVTVYSASSGNNILQTALPEAMFEADPQENHISKLPDDCLRYNAIGIGPGIGMHETTGTTVLRLLETVRVPTVLDADALNLLSIKKDFASHLHDECILTPHPKEFERLFGTSKNDFERMERAKEKAKELNVYILLKTHHTLIACPDGSSYINNTGNPGMATGGSGDVLTGILTGLLAQGYSLKEACLLGTYLHGLAGDLGAQQLSQEALLAGDLIQHIGKAYLQLQRPSV